MIKALRQTNTSVVQEIDVAKAQSPTRVCMHVRGTARTDVRVMREATALTEAGFDVSIVDVVNCDHTFPSEEEIHRIRVKHINMPSWFVPTRFKPWFLVKAAQMLIRSTSRLMQVPANVYHAHDDTALLACYIAARLRRKPLIFDAHELPLFQSPLAQMSIRHRWLRAITARLLASIVPSCAGVITVSSPIAQEIRHHYHASAVTLVRNVPRFQTVQKSDRLRRHLGLSPEVCIALYQGGMQTNRGLNRLIRAAAFLASNIVIVLMGNGPKEVVSELEVLIVSEGVADQVKMIPAVPYQELLDWTASADIGLVVYAPDYSLNVQMCLPNKFFEYLMAGLPVLSSRLDAITEAIKTYNCGQVVSSLAPADIGKAINTMLESHDALARMRQSALHAAQHEFHWEKESRILVQLYHDVLDGVRNAYRV